MEERDLLEKERELREEIEEYNRERDRIRSVIGKIGGNRYSRVDNWINISFFFIIASLFILEITFHLIPAFLSLELGVLLISIKIIWMIHSQQKTNHFQFWMLNSIEYRMNEVYRKVKVMESKMFQENIKAGGEKKV